MIINSWAISEMSEINICNMIDKLLYISPQMYLLLLIILVQRERVIPSAGVASNRQPGVYSVLFFRQQNEHFVQIKHNTNRAVSAANKTHQG